MADQAQSLQPIQRVRAERSAWIMIVFFFLFFCSLVAAGVITGWRYYSSATLALDDAILRVHVSAGVNYLARGSTNYNAPRERCQDSNDDCVKLEHEGDRVVAKPGVGYGPVASLVLRDQSRVDMWAQPTGADLTLEKYQVSRWTANQQQVVLRQSAGYARYDLQRGYPYTTATYSVNITGSLAVQLDPGGSYSINIPGATLPLTMPIAVLDGVEQNGAPARMLAEIAVRAGGATVQEGNQHVTLRPGEKVQVSLSGVIGAPLAAQWELINDGTFTQYKDNHINSWSVTKSPLAPKLGPEEENGTFAINKTCPPQKVDFCEPDDQLYTGQFRRDGQQAKSFLTGIEQPISADVSEFTQTLRLTAWVRVLSQTIDLTGLQGSECPLMFEIFYKENSPSNDPAVQTTCLYTGDGTAVMDPAIDYQRLPRFRWYRLEVELRNDNDLKKVRYIQRIRIEARGHGYLSEITHVSLIGKQ